ncbi:uncharacterized protein LOC126106299 [Schistocerca cancellata]|uniref:uncharacterized protein LOC126106299 n=1 Tax=Schistocerca cancellata TaxID=274614 RepID=UPI00211942E8|nr:uncharacterized protein LOC126106299 [Schistocerca cancellata]
MTRQPFKPSQTTTENVLELVHSDVGFKKSDECDPFVEFKGCTDCETERRLQSLQSDNGIEYINSKVEQLFKEEGILHWKSTVYSPPSNRKAKHLNQTLISIATINKELCLLDDVITKQMETAGPHRNEVTADDTNMVWLSFPDLLRNRWRQHTSEECRTVNPSDPTSVGEALASVHKDKWCTAIASEMSSLKCYNIWKLVDRSKADCVVGSNEVFTTKRSGEGEMVQFKARLVVLGYSQIFGVDWESYSPVIR